MSHEIRTPMNGVLGMLDILQQTALTADQSRMLGVVRDSTQSLLRILNDILDFSKIEAGKLDIEYLPVQLRALVDGSVQLMQSVASKKNVSLNTVIDPSVPEWVYADPTRLHQILFNLISNALKFIANTAGRVTVQVATHTDSAGQRVLHLRVQDNGIGMSEEVLANLFKPFSQADASIARKYGGTGLGLSITKRLVDLLQGQIRVQSVLGEGSQFEVELPLIIAAAPLQPAFNQEQALLTIAQAQKADQLILVAEDNEINRIVLHEQLQMLGYVAEIAEDGLAALALWRTDRYALLLTDCHMPNMDGYALTEAIRKSEPVNQRFPIVAITANAMAGEADRCKARGMDDFLTKPLRLNDLRAMLQKWLPQAQAQPALLAVLDTSTLLDIVGDNIQMQRKLLDKFLQSAENQVSAIASAAAQQQADIVSQMAHSLKSSARTVGALRLGELCNAIDSSDDAAQTLLLAAGLPQAHTEAAVAIRQLLGTLG